VDRRLGVSGAQESDLFLQVLHRARTEAISAGSRPG
jgi:predicted DsbA family dithiol-disulfide isomerase